VDGAAQELQRGASGHHVAPRAGDPRRRLRGRTQPGERHHQRRQQDRPQDEQVPHQRGPDPAHLTSSLVVPRRITPP